MMPKRKDFYISRIFNSSIKFSFKITCKKNEQWLVCVCVCVYIYIYIYISVELSENPMVVV